jgi:hypothetical protein
MSMEKSRSGEQKKRPKWLYMALGALALALVAG